MKVLLKVLIVVLILIFILIRIFSDTQTNTYKSKEEVINDNAIQRGWIPSIIPDSAYKIEEEHNLDTNILIGSFRYDEKDENDFLKRLTKLNKELTWKDFIFIIDTEKNKVEFSNRLKYNKNEETNNLP